MFFKKGVLRNFAKLTEKHLCQRPVFSCEFCEISKNTFFYRTHPVTASISLLKSILQVVSRISTIKKLLRKTQDSQVNTRSSCCHSKVFCQKGVIKNLAKFAEKHICRSLVFNNVEDWKPETVRSNYWRCSVKNVLIKISQISQENTRVGVSF